MKVSYNDISYMKQNFRSVCYHIMLCHTHCHSKLLQFTVYSSHLNVFDLMLHIIDIMKGKIFPSFPCLSPFLFLPFLPPNSNIFNAPIVSHLLPLCAPHSFISLCLAHSLSFHLILFLSFHLFLSRTLLLSLSFCLFLSLHLSLSHSFILSISHPLFPTRFPSPSLYLLLALSIAPLFLTHSVGTSSLSLPNLPNARIR